MPSELLKCCPCLAHEEEAGEPVKKEGILIKQGDGGRRRWVERHFVLHDRRLAYRELDAEDNAARQSVDITNDCTADICADEDGHVLVLAIPHVGVAWRMRARSGLPELRAWQVALTHAIRPRWADQAGCNVCQRRFNVLLRRHHCRRCGFCVCRMCSSTADTLPGLGYLEPTIVCKLCTAPKEQVPLLPASASPALDASSWLANAISSASAVIGQGAEQPSAYSAPVPSHAERIRAKYGLHGKGCKPGTGAGSELHAPADLPAAQGQRPPAHICIVCLDADAVVACLPCGHRCLCEADSKRIGSSGEARCPVCRAVCTQFNRIFV